MATLLAKNAQHSPSTVIWTTCDDGPKVGALCCDPSDIAWVSIGSRLDERAMDFCIGISALRRGKWFKGGQIMSEVRGGKWFQGIMATVLLGMVCA